jgi:hypothetical protein
MFRRTRSCRMRLLNQDDDRTVQRLLLLLTQPEAVELKDSLELLLANSAGRHEHISSEDYKKEITIAIYDPSSQESFDSRSRTLIVTDQ